MPHRNFGRVSGEIPRELFAGQDLRTHPHQHHGRRPHRGHDDPDSMPGGRDVYDAVAEVECDVVVVPDLCGDGKWGTLCQLPPGPTPGQGVLEMSGCFLTEVRGRGGR